MAHSIFGRLRRTILPAIVASFAGFELGAGRACGGQDDPQVVMGVPVVRWHAFAADHSVPFKRGIAILSPLESPDAYDPPVGGKPLVVPYYPDYSPHFHHGPRVLVPYGAHGGTSGIEVPGRIIDDGQSGAVSASYGVYSGAIHDEEYLLHLGGASNSAPSPGPSGIPAPGASPAPNPPASAP